LLVFFSSLKVFPPQNSVVLYQKTDFSLVPNLILGVQQLISHHNLNMLMAEGDIFPQPQKHIREHPSLP
jgi:hypothetical protein